MNEDQIIELETRIAFLEKGQQELSDIVANQQKEILALNKNNQALIEKLKGLVPDEEINPDFEKPPHY